MQAKFRAADVAGWQTGYAFDVLRGVPGAASDDVGQRAEFVASAAASRQELREIGAFELTGAQREVLQRAEGDLDASLAIDERIVAGYRDGSPRAVAAAGELASGESLQVFGSLAGAVGELADSAATSGARATATAERTAAALDEVVGALTGTVRRIAAASATLAGSSQELSAVATQLSAGAGQASEVIARIDALQSTIAAAVEEQSATTAEVVRNVGEVSRAAAELQDLVGAFRLPR